MSLHPSPDGLTVPSASHLSVNGHLEPRGERGATASPQNCVPNALIDTAHKLQPDLVADEICLDLDDGELVLEDLHNDLAYLRSRAVEVCRRIDQVLARNAPMNKLPIEVCMRCGFVDPRPASIRICADSRKRSFSRACSSWAHTTTFFSRLLWMRYAGLGIV